MLTPKSTVAFAARDAHLLLALTDGAGRRMPDPGARGLSIWEVGGRHARIWLALLVVPLGWLLSASTATGQVAAGPSVFCHVTDGGFTVCPGGGAEWSDVPARAFPETESFLYASQADLDPTAGTPLDTFVLMYDECSRRTPLGRDEYFRIAFKTVETENGAEKLEHYVINVFADGTIIFVEDGVVQPPGRAAVVDGMRGTVGFGPSPNCAFDHVTAEFQVPLSITGSSYSPDPLFWGASAPPPPPECPEGSSRSRCWSTCWPGPACCSTTRTSRQW